MFDKLNENTPKKIKVKDFDEAKEIIAKLQQEIKEELKERVKYEKTYDKYETDTKKRIFDFINMWSPQIDYTINPCTEEQRKGAGDESVMFGNSEAGLNNDDDRLKALFDYIRKLENEINVLKKCNIKLAANQAKITDFQSEGNYSKNPERAENVKKLNEETKVLNNEISKTLAFSDADKETETITVCFLELEIRDTLQTLKEKMGEWIHDLVSTAKYPLLKDGKGIKTLFHSLAQIYEYDSNCKEDNDSAVKKVKRQLEKYFDYITVDCQGSYDSYDYFDIFPNRKVDEVVTTKKAIIYKYRNEKEIIKGCALAPLNDSVSEDEE